MTTYFSEVFNSVLKGVGNMPMTAYTKMAFYRVDNYCVLIRKVASARLLEGGPYLTQILAKLSMYIIWANSRGMKVFNFPQDLVEVNDNSTSTLTKRATSN